MMGLIAVIVIIGLFVLVDSMRERNLADAPSDPTAATSANFSPTTQIFNNQYFQFQTDSSWKQVPAETTSTRFVYRSFRGTLVEHELYIYVNDQAPVADTTRVLPVEIGPNSQLIASKISDHCKTALPPNSPLKIQNMKLSDVEFMCNPDATNYSVSVGLKGGSAPMKIMRPNGTVATYGIIYRNVTATPGDQELQEIISAFQIR